MADVRINGNRPESSVDGSEQSDHSRVESTHTTDGVPTAIAIDYWFGKKYFEVLIAEHVFLRDRPEDCSLLNIDFQFEELKSIRGFPFEQAINLLRNETSNVFHVSPLRSSDGAYEALLTVIGTVKRRGSQTEKVVLATVLRKLMASNRPRVDGEPSPLNPARSFMSDDLRSNNLPARLTREKEVPMSMYTTMLKEAADIRGWQLNYGETLRAPENRDMFKAFLDMPQGSFSALGKSTKEAKHRVSKEAWKFLQAQRESTP